jgi:hypothetical protein
LRTHLSNSFEAAIAALHELEASELADRTV